MSNNTAIEVIGLDYSYPDGTEALKGVSLRVERGERMAIIGPNGAGKSTLLTHFNGVKRGRGRVLIDGIEVCDRNIREVRKKVGVVFQDPDDQLFCPTVFDDVAFGPLNMRFPKEEIRPRVARALEMVGLAGFEERASFHLSYGEKKRVSLATVLVLEPDVLVFDEPSSNLDPKGRRGLIRLLSSLDKTMVIAAHDLDLVLELCHRCAIIYGGEIRFEGPTPRVLRNQELLEAHDLELPLSLSN